MTTFAVYQQLVKAVFNRITTPNCLSFCSNFQRVFPVMAQTDYKKYLAYFLYLTGIHSIAVGIGLIFLPPSFLELFGFIDYKESFFQAQGGVFHIAMSVAYIMAGRDVLKSIKLIQFIIVVKFLAFIFLIIYYFFVMSAWLILASGIGDGLMGLIVLILYQRSELTSEEF